MIFVSLFRTSADFISSTHIFTSLSLGEQIVRPAFTRTSPHITSSTLFDLHSHLIFFLTLASFHTLMAFISPDHPSMSNSPIIKAEGEGDGEVRQSLQILPNNKKYLTTFI